MPNGFTSRMKGAAAWLLFAFVALAGGPAAAQDATVGWHPHTGDVWVDVWLGDINRYGARYRDPFIDEIVRYHGAPRPLVIELLDRHWAPGDIYYACAIAAIIGRPCRYVVDMYEADRGQGWGTVAMRLGIKPGSPEFQRLKRGFVPTYDRWARPIELDDELRRAYPDRGRGRPGKATRGAPGQDGKAAPPAKGGPAHRDPGGDRPGQSGKGQSQGRRNGAGKGDDKGNGKGNGKG